MKIAVVGATGNIGAPLVRRLLEAGHRVRALSRGGPKLDALVKLGAEPFIGSFDEGTENLRDVFRGMDAAYTMVKTDWNNPHGHYPAVAARLADALYGSSVRHVVNLGSFGGDVKAGTGHFVGFYNLELILNELADIRIAHHRGGYFMENVMFWTSAIARHGKVAWYVRPEIALPLVATADIAQAAAHELLNPSDDARVVRELGAEDLTTPAIVAVMARASGRPLEAVTVPTDRPGLREEFVRRFGTADRFVYDVESYAAINAGIVKFHTERPPLPTKFADFAHDTWRPVYAKAIADPASQPANYRTWLASL